MEFNYDCDVKKVLKDNMWYIVKDSFEEYQKAQGTDYNENEFLEEWYKIFLYDIDINFDRAQFFFLPYTAEENVIKFNISDKMPLELKNMILYLIEHKLMKENIKNKNYRIHFRVFSDRMLLEDSDNTLRKKAFIELHRCLYDPENIKVFLIRKLLKVRNDIVVHGKDEEDDDKHVRLLIIKRSIETVIQEIEDCTVHEHC